MKALVFAVLLTVMQAAPPVPRKAPDNTNRASQNITSNASGNKAPASPAQPAVNPVTAHPGQSSSQSPKPADAPQKWDWADWILWVFNGLLVVVGFLGIGLAYGTLKAIKRQTEATEVAATAAKLSAEAFLAENRPWLLVEIKDSGLRIQQPFSIPLGTLREKDERFSHCILYNKNYGKTPARVTMQRVELQISARCDEPLNGNLYSEVANWPNPIIFPQDTSFPMQARLTPEGIITIKDSHAIKRRRVNSSGSVDALGIEIRLRERFRLNTKLAFVTCGKLEPILPSRFGVWLVHPNTTRQNRGASVDYPRRAR